MKPSVTALNTTKYSRQSVWWQRWINYEGKNVTNSCICDTEQLLLYAYLVNDSLQEMEQNFDMRKVYFT